MISINGGQARRFVDVNVNSEGGSLSPDGSSIVFAVQTSGSTVERGQWQLCTLNLTNGVLSVVPSSQNVRGPFWINSGTIGAAAGNENEEASAPTDSWYTRLKWNKLVSFDLKTEKWTDLVSGTSTIVNRAPSLDGKYLYYNIGGTEPKAMGVRLADHQVETLTTLKDLRRFVDPVDGTKINVAPDGSLVFTRDIGTREIYALAVKWP